MLKTKKLQDGIFFHEFIDERFKFNTMYVSFAVKMNLKTVSLNAAAIALLRNNVKKYGNFQNLEKKLQSLYGAELSFSCDKFGDLQVVSLVVRVLDDGFTFDGEKLFEEAINLLVEVVFNPKAENGKFFEKDVEKEKQNLINSINSEYASKESFAYNNAVAFLFGEDGCGCFKRGTLKSVAEVNCVNVFEAYENMLKNAQVNLFLISRKDYSNVVCEKFLEKFRSVERANGFNFVSEKFLFRGLPKSKVDFCEVEQAKLILSFALNGKEQDLSDEAISLMVAIFGGAPSSKLFLNVREAKSLCYYCSAHYNKLKGVVWVRSGVDFNNINQAKEEILNQFEAMKEGNFSFEDLKNARALIGASLRSVNDSSESVANYYFGEFFCGNCEQIKTPSWKLKKFEEITKEDVVAAANRFSFASSYVLKAED